jgi:hypothetical protein
VIVRGRGRRAATEIVATFNGDESSKLGEVRMKVRQACEGRVIEARASELKNGGWDSEFSIEEHEATGVIETRFYVPGIFLTAEAAIQAAVRAGQQRLSRVPSTSPLSSVHGNRVPRWGFAPVNLAPLLSRTSP